jgi:hypothetical protein
MLEFAKNNEPLIWAILILIVFCILYVLYSAYWIHGEDEPWERIQVNPYWCKGCNPSNCMGCMFPEEKFIHPTERLKINNKHI